MSESIKYPVYSLIRGITREEGAATEIDDLFWVKASGERCFALFTDRLLADFWQKSKNDSVVNAVFDGAVLGDLLGVAETAGLQFVAFDSPGVGPYTERVVLISEVQRWILEN